MNKLLVLIGFVITVIIFSLLDGNINALEAGIIILLTFIPVVYFSVYGNEAIKPKRDYAKPEVRE